MKKKITIITIVVFVVGLIIAGSSYAFWSWTSNVNKNVVFNIASNLRNYIVYNEGESAFTGELNVSNSYLTGSIHSTISIYKTTNVNMLATLHMDVNQIGPNMKNSTALKWVVTAGTVSNVGAELAHGNFVGANNGDTLTLVPDIPVNITETFYTIWIWLDSSENPSDNLSGETLDTNVWTEINQAEGAEDRYEITNTNANYQQISATVVDSKYKVTHYAITTTNSDPSNWTEIIPTTEQNNVYTLNESVSGTGTYYIWFKDENNRVKNKQIQVSSVDTTAPSCVWGPFAPGIINYNNTSVITLTCTDSESGISVHNLTTADIITSNSSIEVSNIVKENIANGYKYTITVIGTSNIGTADLTLDDNKVRNGVNLGNSSISSDDLMIDKASCVAPTNVQISTAGIVTWTASSTASSYEISIDNETFATATSGIDYKNTIIATSGTRTVYVRSVCDSTYYYTPSDNATKSINVYSVSLTNGTGISTVTGSGNYISGSTVNIGATVASNYSWGNWTDNNNGNAQISTVRTYSGTISSNWNYRANAVADQYTVDFDDNRFNTSASLTAGGLTISYNSNTHELTIDGTQTASIQLQNILQTFTEGDTYKATLTYISGSVSSGDGSNYLICNDLRGQNVSDVVLQYCLKPPSASINTITKTITADAATNGKRLFAMLWVQSENQITYTNYKVKVDFTKVETKTVTYGSTYGTLPSPTRTGYTFDGWYTAETGGTKVLATSTLSVNADHTLYAHWTPESYTVTFDDNRFNAPASMTVDDLTVSYNSNTHELTINGTQTASIQLQNILQTFTEGDTYKATLTYISGSVSSADGSNYLICNDLRGQNVSDVVLQYCLRPPSASINTVTKTITADAATNGKRLFAMLWVQSANQITYTNYKVKVDFTKVETKTVTYGSTYGTLPAPTRAGYTFDGWYTAETGGTKVLATSTLSVNADHTLYAHWTPESYTVTFDDNRFNAPASMTEGGLTITYDSGTHELTITGTQAAAVNLQRILHTFVEGDTYNSTLTYVSGTVTAIDNTTHYLCNDVVNNNGTVYQYCITPPLSSSVTRQRVITADAANNGTHLRSWLYAATGNKVTYTNYKIRVDFTKVETKAVTYGSSYGTLPTPTRTGYTFDGWYTAETGGSKITNSSSVSTAENHTLYAHWTIKEPALIINPNGGSYNGSTSNTRITQAYNTTYQVLNNPTRAGYVFNGWTISGDGTYNPYDTSISPTSTQTINYNSSSSTLPTVYNNSGGGTVTLSMVSDSTASGGYALRMVTNGTASPGAGGMHTSILPTDPSRINVIEIRAKIPTGYNLKPGGVSYYYTGIGSSYIVRPTGGTGSWKTYYLIIYGGDTGTFSSELYLYITGSNNTSVTWYINSVTVKSYTRSQFKSVYQFGEAAGTLTANWALNGSRVRFNTNGGSYNTTYVKNWTNGYNSVSANSSADRHINYSTSYATFPADNSYNWTPDDRVISKTGCTFTGWYTATSNGTKVFNTNGTLVASVSGYSDASKAWIKYDANTNLYAIWSANSYQVCYNKNTTDTVSSMPSGCTSYTYASSGTVNLNSSAPTRTGYTFQGWSTSSTATTGDYAAGAAWSKSNVPNSGNTITLYAIWKAKPVYIYYNPNGGTVGGTYTTYNGWMSSDGSTYYKYTVNSGASVDLMNYNGSNFGITKEGYEPPTASIWCLKNSTTACYDQTTSYTYDQYKANATEKTSNYELNLYVNWQGKAYTVKFYRGLGTSEGGDPTYLGSTSCTFGTTCTLKKYSSMTAVFPSSSAGWGFAGWSISQTSTTRTYSDQQSINPSSYTATLNLYAVGSRTVTYYRPTTASPSTNDTVTYTQYWIPYTNSTTYATSVTVPAGRSIGNSWTFQCYRANDTASSTCGINASYNGSTYNIPVGNLVTYRSIYNRSLSLVYNKNGGTGTAPSTQSATQYYNSGTTSGANTVGATFTLAANTLTKTGNNFNGWAESSSATSGTAAGGTITYNPGLTSTTLTKNVYATWTPKPVYIYYNPNGGTVGGTFTTYNDWMSSDGSSYYKQVVNSGGSTDLVNYNASAFGITKKGYVPPTASIWCLKNSTTVCYDQTTSYTYAQYKANATEKTSYYDLSLYVNWAPVTYSISYNLNGGSHGTNHPTSATYGASPFAISAPSKSGYTFTGWTSTTLGTTAKACTGTATSTCANWGGEKTARGYYTNLSDSTTGVTLVANWVSNTTYTVKVFKCLMYTTTPKRTANYQSYDSYSACNSACTGTCYSETGTAYTCVWYTNSCSSPYSLSGSTCVAYLSQEQSSQTGQTSCTPVTNYTTCNSSHVNETNTTCTEE